MTPIREWIHAFLQLRSQAAPFGQALEVVVARLGGAAGAVYLCDASGDQLLVAAGVGDMDAVSVSMGDGPVGRAWLEGAAALDHADGSDVPVGVAPLWRDGSVVGALAVQGLQAEQLPRLQGAADALAWALAAQLDPRPPDALTPAPRLLDAAELLASHLALAALLWDPGTGVRALNEAARTRFRGVELTLFGGAGAEDGAIPSGLLRELLSGRVRDAAITVHSTGLHPAPVRVHLQALEDGIGRVLLCLLDPVVAPVHAAEPAPTPERRQPIPEGAGAVWVVALALHVPWPPDGQDLLAETVLEQVGDSLRGGDSALGAGEGCLWLAVHALDHQQAERAGRRLAARALTALAQLAGTGWVSVGLALMEDAGADGPIRSAAQAARFANGPANGVVVAWADGEHLAQLRRSEALLTQLTGSRPFEGMHLVFQPILAVDGRAVVEAEALLRWAHPVFGAVGPTEFLPLVRRAGRMVELGDWVIRRALIQLQEWSAVNRSLRMAINVDAEQLHVGDLAGALGPVVQELGLAPGRVTLEITEQAFVEGNSTLEQLRRLARAGYRLAIDDFGAGHSCLDRLVSLPARVAKLDRRLLPRHPDDPRRWPLYEGLVRLLRGTGLEVVAEGVEDDDQFRALEPLGVHLAQGFVLGRPVSAPLFRRDHLEPT